MKLLHYVAYSLFLIAFFVSNMMEQLASEEIENIGAIFMIVSTTISEIILVSIFNIMPSVS